MLKFIIKRVLLLLPTLWGVVTLLFIIFALLGDPSRMLVGQRVDAQTLASIRKELGLDKPLWIQYFLYLKDLSPVDYLDAFQLQSGVYYYWAPLGTSPKGAWVIKLPYLRRSYQNGKSVASLYLEHLPATLLLSFSSLILAALVAVPMGLLAAYYRFSFLDYFLSIGAVIGVSTPSFFAAIFFLWFFAIYAHSWTGLNVCGYIKSESIWGNSIVWHWQNLILPTLTLGLRPMAILFQLMRGAATQVLQQDYIRTARSKGIREVFVMLRHVFPNAFSPVFTALSGWLAALLSGSFFVEYIFGWPGIGKWTVDALHANDYPIVLGSCIFTAFLFMIITCINDLFLAYIDPRIRLL
ncbi:MAG: ABC transporter permease [Bacteroidia bacterium]|nr:ABC transporter permease [Bacteroidia bacterium]MDW8158184.1 ABC transporter permease [Bacteroidia bacterium]